MIHTHYYPISNVGGAAPIDQSRAVNQEKKTGKSGQFDAIFQQELQKTQPVKFSAHAVQRMQDRNIPFNQEDATKLNDAMSRAQQKGSRDSLVVFKDYALIVSVKNNTVVTALDKNQMKEQVVTNIDSTIIA